MRPTPPPAFAATTALSADEPAALPAADAERIERWVGVSATVVVVLAGIAALLV